MANPALLDELLGLPAEERAEIAARLLDSLDGTGTVEPGHEAAWTQVIERRLREARAVHVKAGGPRVRTHAQAEAELAEAAEEIPALVAAVADALAYIEAFPKTAPSWPDLPDVRRRVLGDHPYAIVYAIEPEDIVVVALEHVRRRPR
jgi:putative addiction module component (TIGR02574 family)